MLYACILNGSFCGKISYMIGSPFRPGHSWRLKWDFSWVSDQFQTPRRDRFGMHVCMSVFMYACLECIELKWIDLNLFQTPLKLKSWKKWSCGVALHRCGGVCVCVPPLIYPKLRLIMQNDQSSSSTIIFPSHIFPLEWVSSITRLDMFDCHRVADQTEIAASNWCPMVFDVCLVVDTLFCPKMFRSLSGFAWRHTTVSVCNRYYDVLWSLECIASISWSMANAAVI